MSLERIIGIRTRSTLIWDRRPVQGDDIFVLFALYSLVVHRYSLLSRGFAAYRELAGFRGAFIKLNCHATYLAFLLGIATRSTRCDNWTYRESCGIVFAFLNSLVTEKRHVLQSTPIHLCVTDFRSQK